MLKLDWTVTINLSKREIEKDYPNMTANDVVTYVTAEWPSVESIVMVTCFPEKKSKD